MSNERSQLIAKARKLKAMADRGEENERQSFKARLAELMQKNDISEEEIGDLNELRRFRVVDADDTLILNNVILSINPTTLIYNGAKFTQCNLEEDDFKEVLVKYATAVEQWRVEKEYLKMGFFAKHADFFAPSDAVRKKWLEKRTENPDLRKAKEQAQQMNMMAHKPIIKMGELSYEQKIYMLNQNRLAPLVDLLLELHYNPKQATLNAAKKAKK